MDAPRILVVEHQDDCTLAWFDGWMTGAGALIEVVRPCAGELVPEAPGDADGVVVLGGSMGAHEDERYAWLGSTKRLLRVAVRKEVPTLGICLGHQLLAAALGGRVEANPAGKQMGVLEVGLSPQARGDPLVGVLEPPVRGVQWNDDIPTRLPEEATVLAATPDGLPQIVRFGRQAWGVQMHPEAGAKVIGPWASEDEDRMSAVGRDTRAALRDIADAEEELVATWRPFAERFVAIARRDGSRGLPVSGSGTCRTPPWPGRISGPRSRPPDR